MSARACGTKAKYHIDGCRCKACTEAARIYGQHRARQIAYGRWEPYVDAEPARQHVLALRAAGLGPVTLARLSGVPHGALAKLVYGDRKRGMAPSKRIRRETADRILAVEANIDTLADAAYLDSIGTRRRAQALAAIGWSLSEQARRLGALPSAYHRSVLRENRVTAGRARAVRDLYDELAMTPGSDNRSRLAAARKGWAPPLAWDDDRIDDPTASPDGVGYVPPDRAEALVELDRRQAGISEVCDALGIRRDSVERWCERNGMRDMYVRFMERETPYVERRNQWSA